MVNNVAQQHRRDRCRGGDGEQRRGGQRQADAAPLHQRNDEDERHRCPQQQCDGGPLGEGKPSAHASPHGEPRGRAQQKTRAGEQHQGEEEKKERFRQDLRAEHDESHRQCGENASDQCDGWGDQGTERGDERAGRGVDHGLNERDRPGSVAEYMLDARDQQRIKRHAVGHGQERRPKGFPLRQRGAECPITERILLREEGVAMRKQCDIDQADEQGEDKGAL